MREDILQRFFGSIDVSGGKHEKTIERTRQMNLLSSGLNHLDISPPVFFDASLCVDADLWADLDTDHLTRLADCTNEVRKAAGRSATHIENAIALFWIKQLDCLLTHRLNEGRIEIREGSE